MQDNRIYQGDALKLLKRVKPGSVRLLLTDTPYNISRKNNFHTMGRRGIEFSWDGGFDQTGWLRFGVDTLMPWGSIVVFNDWKNLGQIAEGLRILGMKVCRPFKWYKTNPKPANIKRVPVQRCEYAVWAVKPSKQKPTWVFNPDLGPTKGFKGSKKGYEDGFFFHPIQIDPLHKTKKPDALFEEIIRLLSNPGELVLDPFCGTGTLAVAAERAGRRHISFELDPLYYAWANVLLRRDREKRKDGAGRNKKRKKLHI